MPATNPISPTDQPILLATGDAESQNRLTVLFRLLIAIPHIVAATIFAIVIVLAAIVGWFAVLFTGSLPESLSDFFAGYLQYLARCYSYVSLLTDRYPPFSLEAVDYPVQLSVTTDTVRRGPALAHFILVIPAAVFSLILGIGGFVLFGIIDWVIVLIRGRQPDSIHGAFSTVIRFQIRTVAYWLLLTAEYPGTLFGDGEAPDTIKSARAAKSRRASYAQKLQLNWGLYIDGASKSLIRLFIVLGAIILVASAVVSVPPLLRTPKATPAQLKEVTAGFNTLINAMNTYGTAASKCDSGTGSLSCLTSPIAKTETALVRFSGVVDATNFPTASATKVNKLKTVITNLEKNFNTLKDEKTAAGYQSFIQKSDLSSLLNDLSSDYDKVINPSK